MNILEDYIQHPLMPLKKDNPDINRVENNELCDDSIEVYIDLEESQLKDFSYTGNLSLTALGVVSLLHDLLPGMTVESIRGLEYSFLEDEGVLVSTRRKKTAALPLVAIINALHNWKGDETRLDVEQFAYSDMV